MVKHGRHEDGLLVELFWHRTIPISDIAITLICPYEHIPHTLVRGLQELHNCPLYIANVWDITPANYKCVECGKMVSKELRIYEPLLMVGQSEVVSAAMNANDAGWIPFCFSCIATHPYLRPPWLKSILEFK